MTDKITKLLRQLTPRQLKAIEAALICIVNNELDTLDVKALKGRPGFYRARVGNYRIIFARYDGEKARILVIARRNEGTY